LTRKFTLNPSCSLQRVANALPFTYTGADLYALCSDAMLKAITRAAQKVDQKVVNYNSHLKTGESAITIAQFFDHHATDEDVIVTVTEEDFIAAQNELVPSVSAEEFTHYERVRKAFEGTDSTSGTQQGSNPPKLKINHQAQKSTSKTLPERLSTGSQPRSVHSNNNSAKSPPPNVPNFKRQASTTSRRSDRSTFYFDQTADGGSGEDEDDYIIRGDQISSPTNGYVDNAVGFGFKNEVGNGKKGKGATFGSATNGDDELYQ